VRASRRPSRESNASPPAFAGSIGLIPLSGFANTGFTPAQPVRSSAHANVFHEVPSSLTATAAVST